MFFSFTAERNSANLHIAKGDKIFAFFHVEKESSKLFYEPMHLWVHEI